MPNMKSWMQSVDREIEETATRSRERLVSSFRSDIDLELGRAAASLESVARKLAGLSERGVEFEADGVSLEAIRSLSRHVLDLQVQARKANHQ